MNAGRVGRKVGIWLGSVVLAAVGLLLVLRLGVGIYLGTSSGKAAVAHQLESLIGLPVEVSHVGLGASTSSVAFKVTDPALAGRPDAEVLAVDSASADVSFADVLTGRANPKEVRLRGVRLTLRIDANGKILTTLPTPSENAGGSGPPPAVTLDGGEVRIRQEGKPEFALAGLHLTMTPDGNKLVLDGTIDDREWGKWRAAGEVDRPNKGGWLELTTDDGPLVTEKLRSIPYVPNSIWEHVQPNGRGGAKVRLVFEPAGDVKYDVEVRPKGAALGVPDADTTLTDLTGLIHCHGTKVEVAGCQATVAGGRITATGGADFGPEPTVVNVKVTATRLDVGAVPPSWGVPKDFGGHLTGSAVIALKVPKDGPIDPAGSHGRGKIEDATIRGLPAEVELHLRTEGNRLRLNQGSGAPAGEPQSRAVPTPRDPVLPVLLTLLDVPNAEVAVAAAEPPAAAVPALPQGLARFAPVLTQPPKQPDPKTPAPKQPAPGGGTALDATVTFRDVDVGQLFTKLDVKVPVKLAGKVTAKLSLTVPVERAGTVGAYFFRGTISSPALTIENLTVTDAFAQIDFHNGVLTLQEVRGKVARPDDPKAEPGTFTGSASAQIDPPGQVKASFAFDRLPPGEVLGGVPGWAVEVRGVASGKAEFTAPYNAIDDPATWTASAGVTSDELVVAGRPVTAIKFAARVEKGTATITDAAATIAGIPVTAKGTLGLTGKYAFTAELHTTPTSIADLRKLAPELQIGAVEGLLEVDAKVAGALSPVSFAASGSIRASQLRLASTPANHVELKWEADQDRLRVTSLTADLFGGKVTGSAEYPFDPTRAGKFAVGFDKVDAAAASALVPDFPVKVTGRVTGKVTGVIAPEKPNESRIGDLQLELGSDRLTVQGIPTDTLEGTATIKAGVVNFALKGKTLGGDFDIKGSYPGQGKDARPKGDRGVVRLRNLDLSRLAPELNYPALAPLRGRVSLTFEFDADLTTGSGRVEVTGFGWGNAVAAPDLRGVLILDNGMLSLRELSGPFARGLLEVRARVFVKQPNRNFFAIELHRVNARELLAPFPEIAESIDGELSAVIRGSYNRHLRLDGTVALSRGRLAGIAVDELSVPFRLATGSGGFTELAIREATTRAGSGRLHAEATLVWGASLHVDARIRFDGVPLATVVPTLGSSSLVGNGRITGRFDLTGQNVRSVDDLNGTLIAALQGATPAQIPLIQQATPYLNPFGLVRPFDTGDVRANLSRGIFRVQRLTLVSPSAQLFAEGTVSLSGRVDLQVVAHTGQIGPDAQALRLFGLRLPVIGPIPLSLISDVSAFLSNRTIRLEITGTTSSPVVRVNTRALLTEQAVRFFLTRYVLPAEAVDVFGAGSGIIGGTTGNRK